MTTEAITGLLIAKNEEQDLPACLQGWQGLCSEIVVVDDGSSDATVDIAKAFHCRVMSAAMDDETGYSGLRNQGLDEVDSPMVLVFDADERPTPRLAQAILAADTRERRAYQITRRNNAFGGWLDHGRFAPDNQVRLFPSDIRYNGIVHETPVLPADMEVTALDGQVEHFTYKSVGEYIQKMREYARKEAEQGRNISAKDILRHQAANMIKRKGFLDGWRGLAMAAGDLWYDLMIRHHANK